MRAITLSCAVLGTALVPMLYSAPAQAQATRTWVSGVGDDVNPCSRTAPCKTYAGAISKTATNGEINCLDPAGFGALTITKSISVVCDYTNGGVLAGTGTVQGFLVNATAGSVITLKGQNIECTGTGQNGIRILNAATTVHIHKTQIRNCRGAGSGINIAPTSGTTKVFIDSSYITDNGNDVSDAGILIRPTAGASVNVSVTRTNVDANQNGIFMDGSGAGGISNLVVKDSVLSNNAFNGISVSSSGPTFVATVANGLISLNAAAGASVGGAAATLRLGGNTIAGNVTGVNNAGGTLQSFKNNQIAGNVTDGTPITAVNSGGNILN